MDSLFSQILIDSQLHLESIVSLWEEQPSFFIFYHYFTFSLNKNKENAGYTLNKFQQIGFSHNNCTN